MKNKRIAISGCIIIFMLLTIGIMVCMIFGNKINSQYPPSKRICYSYKEPMCYGDFELKLDSSKFYSYEELSYLYGDKFDKSEYEDNYNTDDLLFAVVKINVTNKGDFEQSIPLYNACIGTLTYSNGIDTTVFAALNGSLNNLVPTIPSHSSIDVYFTYMLFNSLIESEDKIELVMQLYPQRIAFSLN